jgi:di/tricarboxylate transporter
MVYCIQNRTIEEGKAMSTQLIVCLVIFVLTGALTAYMTPMPTAAVPCMMEYGGYSQKDLLRGGWLHSVISCVLSVGWIMTVMPVR